jgi:predicted nucleic acid-binding protein
MRTYPDSGLLIAAARGTDDVSAPALHVLDDPGRELVCSDLVRLEVRPKPHYFGRKDEVAFYDAVFEAVVDWAELDRSLVQSAMSLAERYGLAAVDALHVAAAIALGAEELITTERPARRCIVWSRYV